MLPDMPDASYAGSMVSMAYELDQGLIMMPVAGPMGIRPATRISRVHVPQMVKVVSVWAKKEGGCPRLPSPYPDPNSGVVLMKVVLAPAVPEIRPTGLGRDMLLAANYYYALLNPLTPGKDTFPVGIQPYEFGANTAYDLTPSVFYALLSGHGGSPPDPVPPLKLR